MVVAIRNDLSVEFLLAGYGLLLESCEGNVRDFGLSSAMSYRRRTVPLLFKQLDTSKPSGHRL